MWVLVVDLVSTWWDASSSSRGLGRNVSFEDTRNFLPRNRGCVYQRFGTNKDASRHREDEPLEFSVM